MALTRSAKEEMKCTAKVCHSKERTIPVDGGYRVDRKGNPFHVECHVAERPDMGESGIVPRNVQCSHEGCNVCPDGNPKLRGIIPAGQEALRFVNEPDQFYHRRCFAEELKISQLRFTAGTPHQVRGSLFAGNGKRSAKSPAYSSD